MKFLYIYIFLLIAGCLTGAHIYAQKGDDKGKKANQSAEAARKAKADSTAKARQYISDSTAKARMAATEVRRKEQQRALDSSKAVRQKSLDSVTAIRKRTSDSLAVIRKYKESKRYKDSVAKSRLAKTTAIQAQRKRFTDSVTAARKKVTDSTTAARKRITDSTRVVVKHRTDSLAARRKYRESKRYSDSVAVVRKLKADSIGLVRKKFSDSMKVVRKAITDSVARKRKATTDSIAAVRKTRNDSITAVRKVRTDSLAKVKERKANEQKRIAKDKEKKQQLAFELKIKKKHQAWSNEKMLKKKWSPPRQLLQNTVTRYNYFFNSDKKMDEALLNMQRGKKENFDSLLAMYPFDPDRDSSSLSSDMDSIIQKTSIGIQIHDPRTKWGDDLYLLMGQAYYYKGSYNEASTVFRYILSLREKDKKKQKQLAAKNAADRKAGKGLSISESEKKGALDFLKHRSVHNEALLWLARTYTESHQLGNAESVIDLLETDANFPENLKGRLALEKAYIYLDQNDDQEAIKQLTIAAADKNVPDWLRMRAAFINGQLQERRGKYPDAVNSFTLVIDLLPKIDMDFYARKNLAYNKMLSGSNQEEAVAAMKKILGDAKYSPYYEQVYYVMGRLSANTGNNEDAIRYLKQGLASFKTTKKQKALSYASLGDVYYATGDYVTAKLSYDSASLLADAAPNDSLIMNALRRSVALEEVTAPYMVIKNNDSLFNLAALSGKDQIAAVRSYIRALEKKRNDSIFAAENAGLNAALQSGGQNNNQGSAGAYSNWYFSNPTLLQQGSNDFKRKWGNRPLADNWRRSSAGGAIATGPAAGSTDEPDNTATAVLDENGLPTEESLLALIPNSEEMKQPMHKRSRRSYVDLATAYIKSLYDYKKATDALDTLDVRYPAHEHKAEVLYLRYLAALRQNKLPEAQGYSAKLLQDHNDSKWADLVRPAESGSDVGTVSAAQFYDEVYDMVMQRQYETSFQKVKEGQRRYSDKSYAKRFTILEGASLVGLAKYEKADTLLNDFIAQNPTDTLRPWAEALLSYIKKNKPVASAVTKPVMSTTDSIAAGIETGAQRAALEKQKALSQSQSSTQAQSQSAQSAGSNLNALVPPGTAQQSPVNYLYEPKITHYAVFAFTEMNAKASGIRAAMEDFNKFKYSASELKSSLEMLREKEGMVITRQFKDAATAKAYLNELKSNGQVFREYKQGEYELFIISSGNFRKLMNDRDIKAYLKFYRGKY